MMAIAEAFWKVERVAEYTRDLIKKQ